MLAYIAYTLYYVCMKINTGMKIKIERIKRGISQKGLAKLAGCDDDYLGRIERENLKPSDNLLNKIADALGVNRKELI